METTSEIPKIAKPNQQNPSPVSAIYPDYDFVDSSGTHVVQGHYWRRVKATNIPCGNGVALAISEKTGISQALLVEVASALEVAVAPLKSSLSSKMSSTETITDERTVSFTRTVGPKDCIGITFAEWQKVFHSVLRRQKYFLGVKTRIAERTIDIGTEEFFSDQFEYPDPGCCPAKIEEPVAKGFTDVFSFNFGEITFSIFAKKKDNGKISLAGIPGEFTPGEVVANSDVEKYLLSYGHKPQTPITLSHSLGTVDEFYGWAEKRSGKSTAVLPWMIVLGCSSLFAYLMRPMKGHLTLEEKRRRRDQILRDNPSPSVPVIADLPKGEHENNAEERKRELTNME